MARVNPLLPALNSGEFSPRTAARVDVERYGQGAEVLRNMIPLTQGGAMRRPGTRFVAEVKDSAVQTRLLRFEFSDEQAYVVEAGDGTFRFYRNQGRIFVADSDAVIVNGNFASALLGWSDKSGAGSSISHDAAKLRLNLASNGTTDAHAEQAVPVGAQFQAAEHVIRLQVFGAPGDKIKLRIGTTSGGQEIIDDEVFAVGFHTRGFTPNAATFHVQFLHRTGKTLQVDEVALIANVPVELVTPYGAADLAKLKRAQTADVMYLARGGKTIPVHKLARKGHSSWSLIEVAWQDGPWLEQNEDSAKTLTASAVTGLGITITAAGHAPFAATDLGRLLRLQHGGNEPGWAVITQVNSTTQVIADVRRNFNAITASDKWRLGAWSGTTGYPATVGFFEQRLHLANTPNQTQTFWGSQSADIENMRPDSFEGSAVVVEDDDALDYTIAADDVNPILWLSPGQQLVLGTGGGEWLVKSEGAVLTPNDIDVKRQTTHGSADVAPVRVGHVVLFLQKGGRKIREFAFAFDADGYRAPDLTIFADHITRGGVADIAYQEEPDSNVWCARKDGVLAALTYKREQNVVGWGRSVIGGSFSGDIAVVESVATIPGNTATGSEDRDEAWIIVKRTIDGATRRYVEFFEAAYEGPLRDDFAGDQEWQAAVLAAQKGAFYVDSGLSYDGPPIAAVAGLGHLEGETVKVFADGAVQGDRIVSAGSITLERPAGRIQVGLPYSHRYKSLKLAQGAQAGTAVGKPKRVHGLTLLLMDAAEGAFKVGPGPETLKAVPLREVGDAMDTAVPLFTGEVFIEFDGDYQRDARIFIAGDDPTPFTLLALAPEMKTNEQV